MTNNDTQTITVGNAVGHTQGIKPTAQEEYFEFDEENSPFSEEQMAKYISNNIDEGDKIELILSPDNEGEFIEINTNPGGSKNKGGNNYSDNDDSINRQSAFKSVAGMWDERPANRKEYKRFKAMVKDAQDFIENGEFMTGDEDIFIYEDDKGIDGDVPESKQMNPSPQEG